MLGDFYSLNEHLDELFKCRTNLYWIKLQKENKEVILIELNTSFYYLTHKLTYELQCFI